MMIEDQILVLEYQVSVLSMIDEDINVYLDRGVIKIKYLEDPVLSFDDISDAAREVGRLIREDEGDVIHFFTGI